VPNTPVTIGVPRICVKCGHIGTVMFQHTIKGQQIVLEWRCSACEGEWPVTHKEQTPLEAD